MSTAANLTQVRPSFGKIPVFEFKFAFSCFFFMEVYMKKIDMHSVIVLHMEGMV